MATLRKLRETELIGGTSNEDLYPITSALGVYTKDNERLQDYIDELGNLYSFAGIVGPGDAPLGNKLLNEYYLAIDSGVYVNFDSYEILDNEICIFMHNTKSGWKIYSFLLGSGGGGEGYVLPIASENRLGGIKTGFTQKNKCYPVQVDAEGNAYVCVPWEGGGGGEEPGDIPVTGVTLNRTQMTMTEGSRGTLTATVSPSNATNKKVTWSSSNPSIVTITSTGGSTASITAVSKGTATITVTTEDGNKKATCVVTVTDEQSGNVPVTGVTLDRNSEELEVNEMTSLYHTVSPENATNKEVTYESSNPDIVEVIGFSNERVTIKAVAVGNATITVTTVDGEYTAQCEVTVTEGSGGNVPVRSYFGVVSDDFVVNEQNIKENTEELNLSSKNYTTTVEMDYQKTLYAYPKSYGALESIKDANGFEYLLSYTREEISMNGEDYYVYILTDAATIPMFKQIYS